MEKKFREMGLSPLALQTKIPGYLTAKNYHWYATRLWYVNETHKLNSTTEQKLHTMAAHNGTA